MVYNDLYKGIDLTFYGNSRQFEYDITVSPISDSSQVKLWNITPKAAFASATKKDIFT